MCGLGRRSDLPRVRNVAWAFTLFIGNAFTRYKYRFVAAGPLLRNVSMSVPEPVSRRYL